MERSGLSTAATAVPNFILTRRYLFDRLISEPSNDAVTDYGQDAEDRLVQHILPIQDDTTERSSRMQHNYLDPLGRRHIEFRLEYFHKIQEKKLLK